MYKKILGYFIYYLVLIKLSNESETESSTGETKSSRIPNAAFVKVLATLLIVFWIVFLIKLVIS